MQEEAPVLTPAPDAPTVFGDFFSSHIDEYVCVVAIIASVFLVIIVHTRGRPPRTLVAIMTLLLLGSLSGVAWEWLRLEKYLSHHSPEWQEQFVEHAWQFPAGLFCSCVLCFTGFFFGLTLLLEGVLFLIRWRIKGIDTAISNMQR